MTSDWRTGAQNPQTQTQTSTRYASTSADEATKPEYYSNHKTRNQPQQPPITIGNRKQDTTRPKHERTSPASTTIIAKTHKHAHPATPGGPPPSTASQAATLPVPDVFLVTPLSEPPRIPPQQTLNLTKHRFRGRPHKAHTLITSARIPEQGQNLPATSCTRPSPQLPSHHH